MNIDHDDFVEGYLAEVYQKNGTQKLQAGLRSRIERDCIEFMQDHQDQLAKISDVAGDVEGAGRAFAQVRLRDDAYAFRKIIGDESSGCFQDANLLDQSAASWKAEGLSVENGQVVSDDVYQNPTKPTLAAHENEEFNEAVENIERQPLLENDPEPAMFGTGDIPTAGDDVAEEAWQNRVRLEVLILHDNSGALTIAERKEMNALAEILCEKLSGKDPQEFLAEVRTDTLAKDAELEKEWEKRHGPEGPSPSSAHDDPQL